VGKENFFNTKGKGAKGQRSEAISLHLGVKAAG
jgi:hypothetical protein